MGNSRAGLYVGMIVAFSGFPLHAGPSFTALDSLTGDDTFVLFSMSADGSVLVGRRTTPEGWEAARWSSQDGVVGLGDLPGGEFESRANDVSADGSVIVGYSEASTGREAFMWTQAGGMVGLGFYDNGREYSSANAVSADGSAVVGIAAEAGYVPDGTAFRRTATDGMVSLGTLPFDDYFSEAHDVSADGSVVVGVSDNNSTDREGEAFLWTAEDGMVGLGNLGGTNVGSKAISVSDDGKVIVGWAQGGIEISGIQAFRWTEETGLVELGFAPSQNASVARAVSGDGSVIVGSGSNTSGAFIWDEEHGMRSMEDYLSNDIGLDISGWKLTNAHQISPDGRIIAGSGYNPEGYTENWIAVVPEPSAITLSVIAAILCGACAVRNTRNKI